MFGKTKDRQSEAAEPEVPVTRAEFEAFKTLLSYLIVAIDGAAKAGPGLPDANPRRRFEKLAAAADLEPASLRGFLKLLDKAGKAESEREFREEQERRIPSRHGYLPMSGWRG